MCADRVDTIAAQATAPGRGGIGIIRVSGPDSADLARALVGELPPPRVAVIRDFLDADGVSIDQGILLYFPAPASFTGEDVVEFHGHGGPVVMDMLLRRITALGARLARPGEFSERAFLNNKIDLAQAEAIADLIDSASEQAARSAVRSLQGKFSQRVNRILDAIIELRVYVEAAIDFPEEEIDFLGEGHVAQRVVGLQDQLQAVLDTAQQGRLLRDGLIVVLTGAPNAGKSSVMNRLAGYDAAIVTEMPGTTRDVLREHVQVDGLPLQVIDTAGLRSSSDRIEQEGIRRAQEQLARADLILHIIDDENPQPEEVLGCIPPNTGAPVLDVYNKIDLSNREPGAVRDNPDGIAVSALTGAGFEFFRSRLREVAGYRDALEGGFTARRRHVEALQHALVSVEQGLVVLNETNAGELLAEELRCAQQSLREITGAYTSDDLLGEIFSSFCIGK